MLLPFGKISETMYPGGYTAEVTSLSPKVTEKDICSFFSHCGILEHVEIIRSGGYGCTAYVTFKDAYALETAILLSGATIVDYPVSISRWGSYVDEYDSWSGSSWQHEQYSSSTVSQSNQFVSTPGQAVTVAQEVVTTMISKGYILGKDALAKAKAFDESLHLSAIAAAKIAELSNRIGLTDKIYAGIETVKSIDDKYHVSDITKTVATATGRTAVQAATVTSRTTTAAATAVVNSSYFATGALWVSDVLNRAAKAAADMGSHATNS